MRWPGGHAHRRRGQLTDVPVEDVAVGDHLLVRPFEVVPVDGVLESEAATLDESSLTGESLPVDRRQGEELLSGAINGGEAIEVLVVATPCPLTIAAPVAFMGGMSRSAHIGIIVKSSASWPPCAPPPSTRPALTYGEPRVASNSADVVITLDDLTRAVHIGKRTMRVVWQAIGIGLAMSIGLMIIAAFGMLPAIVGAWLQEVVNLATILWALLAMRPSRAERSEVEQMRTDLAAAEHPRAAQPVLN